MQYLPLPYSLMSYAFIFAGSDDEDDAAGRYRSSQRSSQPISKVRVLFFFTIFLGISQNLLQVI
jgi:hypothetical protein